MNKSIYVRNFFRRFGKIKIGTLSEKTSNVIIDVASLGASALPTMKNFFSPQAVTRYFPPPPSFLCPDLWPITLLLPPPGTLTFTIHSYLFRTNSKFFIMYHSEKLSEFVLILSFQVMPRNFSV